MPTRARSTSSVGVYKDSQGSTPILASVKEAEQRLLVSETSKSYLPIEGAANYGKYVRELLFGARHEILASGLERTHRPDPGWHRGIEGRRRPDQAEAARRQSLDRAGRRGTIA
jgi:hypothetical protein